MTVAYDDSGSVRSLLESAGVEFDADYEAEVVFDVRVPTSRLVTARPRPECDQRANTLLN